MLLLGYEYILVIKLSLLEIKYSIINALNLLIKQIFNNNRDKKFIKIF